MLMLLTFLRGPLGRYAGLALAILAIALGLMHLGANGVRKADAKKEAAAQARVEKIDANAARITSDASAKNQAAQVQIQTRYRTLIQKVTEYVPASADAECRIEPSFIQLWNLGASDLPEVPSLP